MLLTALFVGSYLLGSIPFGLLLGKAWKGIDIRNYGSGNIGATNTMRALGIEGFIVVFILDSAKGFVPILVAQALLPGRPWLVVACGMVSILGHTLSLFLRFKGGRGAATTLGVVIGLNPAIAAIGFGAWIVVVAITRYVSLASIVTSVVIPSLFFAWHLPLAYRVFSIIAGLLVIVKHRDNIGRLLRGTESKWGQKVKIEEKTDGQEREQ